MGIRVLNVVKALVMEFDIFIHFCCDCQTNGHEKMFYF